MQRLIYSTLLALSLTSFAGAQQPYLSEDFTNPTIKFSKPNSWEFDAPTMIGVQNWKLINFRTDFRSDPGCVQFENGRARLWDLSNSAQGGYLGLVHDIPEQPTSWKLTIDVRVDMADFPNRPVPDFSIHGPTTVNYPNDPPRAGWGVSSGQRLTLRNDRSYASSFTQTSNYTLTAQTWHTIEIISRPSGAEMRAWPTGGSRPATPILTDISMGECRRVHFGGPNWKNFDYSIGRVLLEPHPTGLTLNVPTPGTAGRINDFVVTNAAPNSAMLYFYGRKANGTTAVSGCSSLTLDIRKARYAGFAIAGPSGVATLQLPVPSAAAGVRVYLQAVDASRCEASNRVTHVF